MINLYYAVLFGVLALYVGMFSYETVLSFRRLQRSPGPNRLVYVDATWETTHTLLVFAFTLFIITFSAILPTVASLIFLPLLLTGVALLLRAIFYLYIFYVRSPQSDQISWPDYWFAGCHVGVLGGLITTVMFTAMKVLDLAATPNLAFFDGLIPGLVVVLLVSAIPLVQLYRRHSS